MNLLLDQGLPRGAVSILRQAGHDTVHAGDIGLATAEDTQILSRAVAEQRVVITLDADFHALLALSGADKPSVIRIRIEGLKAAALAKMIADVIDQCGVELQRGAMISVTEFRIRIRNLPLIGGGAAP
jgi:predicted nuclease of predicted toxin-antitoxin system